jgi:hypothetical protein
MQKLYVCKLNILQWQNKKMMADFAFLQPRKYFQIIYFSSSKRIIILLIFNFCVRQSYAFLE